MNSFKDAASNTRQVTNYFRGLLNSEGEKGDIGFAKFSKIYDELLTMQQEKLRNLTSDKFRDFYDNGTIASICIAYRNPIIDYIDVQENGVVNYDLWNSYALEYDRLNQLLDNMTKKIASEFDGIALTATIGGVIDKVSHVHDYFGMVISHRVVAELAGLGWRGKNQLIIHDKYSCAVRFASIILSIPLLHGEKRESRCGECTACEEVCTFIKNRESLPEYRENCRRYILHLQKNGIEKDICGKCIKACYRRSLLKDEFDLSY